MTQLAALLDPSQIEAAGRLYLRLEQWQLANSALKRLADCCPGFDREATLLKVVAINALYGTNLYALVRMAEHVSKTLKDKDLNCEGPELVERLASLPRATETETLKRFRSFASKFAHFFIDSECFPIMDSYAIEMLTRHLGRRNMAKNPAASYLAFVDNMKQLRESACLKCSSRELDQYLWVAGLYRRWKKDANGKMNREASNLFQAASSEVASDLKSLIGA